MGQPFLRLAWPWMHTACVRRGGSVCAVAHTDCLLKRVGLPWRRFLTEQAILETGGGPLRALPNTQTTGGRAESSANPMTGPGCTRLRQAPCRSPPFGGGDRPTVNLRPGLHGGCHQCGLISCGAAINVEHHWHRVVDGGPLALGAYDLAGFGVGALRSFLTGAASFAIGKCGQAAPVEQRTDTSLSKMTSQVGYRFKRLGRAFACSDRVKKRSGVRVLAAHRRGAALPAQSP